MQHIYVFLHTKAMKELILNDILFCSGDKHLDLDHGNENSQRNSDTKTMLSNLNFFGVVKSKLFANWFSLCKQKLIKCLFSFLQDSSGVFFGKNGKLLR